MRNKLMAVVLVPSLLAGMMTTISLVRTLDDAHDYEQFSDLARFHRPVFGLVRALQDEREVTASFIAGGRKSAGSDPRRERAVSDRATTAYLKAAADVDATDDPQLQASLDAISRELRRLPELRTSVDRAGLTQSSILADYTSAVRRLMDLGPTLAAHNGGSKAGAQVRALNALSQAVENTSRVQATLNGVLTTRTFLVGQFSDFAGAVARQQQSVADFRAVADKEQQDVYANTVTGASVSTAQAIQDRVIEQAQASRLDVELATWQKASSRKVSSMRQAESHVLDDLIATSSRAQASQQTAALWGTAGILAVFALTGWMVVVVVRSMTRPLRQLRAAAMDVADNRLPEALDRLRQADLDDLGDYRATPTEVTSKDEIGEVAEAFDAVQNAAVALVKGQAALRAHINGMFLHLSRRNQQLVGKLLTEIGDLEQNEPDPDQLARLFRLDHLATQMQRTDESLLVLAGNDSGRTWDQPMPLANILLAAGAEVEQYTRIDCQPAVSADIAAHAVTDLVHLLAELMENATHFSGPGSRVLVTCRTASDRFSDLVVSVQDCGFGMAPEHLAKVNRRLAYAGTWDPEADQSMGLFVVGRLAAKHAIRVDLVSAPSSGTTALVRIPQALLAVPPAAHSDVHEHVPPPMASDDEPGGTGALPGTDSAPVFASREEWLAQRRLTQDARSGDAPSHPRSSPRRSDGDAPGSSPIAEGHH